jgi:hypothetical protein
MKHLVWILYLATLGAGNAMAVEEAKYSVELKEEAFEVRLYEPHILAETIVEAEFEDAGSAAFNRLFKYISGNNTTRQTVAMTAPVGQEDGSEKISMTSPVGQQRINDRWAVSFMMPASYTMETVPTPSDQTVVMRQVPARHSAAIQYSGFWSEKSYQSNKASLETWIRKKGFTVEGEPVWARYNAPFTPWFLRRNEILIPIEPPLRTQ